MIHIANDYLHKMGLEGQPFLVYQHFDAGHPHVHVATVIIADGGKRLNAFGYKGGKSFDVSNELEEKYGLVIAGAQKEEQVLRLQSGRLERVVYGQVEVGISIARTVAEVLRTYKCCSLPEFNLILNQFGILATRGRPESRMYNGKGLMYRLLNDNYQTKGVPVKASNIYGKPTLKNLEKRFAHNLDLCGPNKQRIQYILDKALACSTKAQMEQVLHNYGLRIIFRKNPEGNVFGAAYIDNAACAVFTDDQMGANYRAEVFLNRLSAIREDSATEKLLNTHEKPTNYKALRTGYVNKQTGEITTTAGSSEAAAEENTYPASELPVIQTFTDRLYYDYTESAGSYLASAKLQMRLKQQDTSLKLKL